MEHLSDRLSRPAPEARATTTGIALWAILGSNQDVSGVNGRVGTILTSEYAGDLHGGGAVECG
jgi:hypothetical protein